MLPTSSELLMRLSHELRTPLTTIIGLSEMMEGQAEDEAGYAQRIRTNGTNLLRLIEDILKLARLTGGEIVTDVHSLSVDEVLEAADQTHREMIDRAGLRLVVGKAPDCPPRIEADAELLQLSLRCILENAIKFAGRGTIWLRAERSTAGGVALAVQDEGPGVPTDLAELIFDDFRQGDERIDREHHGAGLGLALARRALGAMRGRLELLRSVRGACFSLELPSE
ncbi:MAG: hypothetical protein CME06_06100 [Gemmatimonadetes bacterium]|nr:hypothetical protein [Gemmatimonadota bacterium]